MFLFDELVELDDLLEVNESSIDRTCADLEPSLIDAEWEVFAIDVVRIVPLLLFLLLTVLLSSLETVSHTPSSTDAEEEDVSSLE